MKKIIYSLGIVALLLTTACDRYLDVVDPNRQTTADFWQTEAHAVAGVTAIYNAFTTDGAYMRSFPGLTDSRGDDFTGDSPWSDLELTGQFIIPSNSAPVQWIWRDFYNVIFRANQVLDNVSIMDETIIKQEVKDRALGQAYFLRGLAYYNLATTFKVVPIITETPKSKDDYYPPTAPEEALWERIYEDFAEAERLLPVSYDAVTGPDRGQKGRATKGAAAGMLGKSYLYRKNWQAAATQFAKFSTGPLSGVYRLMPNYRDNFKDVNENNAESLFEIQFSEEGGTLINWAGEPNVNWKQVNAIAVTYGMDGKGFSDYLPTRWIYNEFKKEQTIDGKSDPRLLATIASYEPADNSTQAYGAQWPFPIAENRIYPRKYTYDGLGKSFENFESGINYRVLRYSDILLMHAEALNELGQTAAAYPLIQQVRDRARLPELATTKPNMSQLEMRDQIAHERALEFAIEGQRINDIIRWGWLYDPAKLAELKARDSDFNSWTPGNEYLPIPQTELDFNRNLSPNPAN
jgi:starch-binding outer membrane protein, SusD/RagB family